MPPQDIPLGIQIFKLVIKKRKTQKEPWIYPFLLKGTQVERLASRKEPHHIHIGHLRDVADRKKSSKACLFVELPSVSRCFWVAQQEFVYCLSSAWESPTFPLTCQTPDPFLLRPEGTET